MALISNIFLKSFGNNDIKSPNGQKLFVAYEVFSQDLPKDQNPMFSLVHIRNV